MRVPCNCDTGGRSGRQVHDPDCAGIPSLYGAWMSEYTCREWMKEQQEIIDALKSALETVVRFLEPDEGLSGQRYAQEMLSQRLDQFRAVLKKARGES